MKKPGSTWVFVLIIFTAFIGIYKPLIRKIKNTQENNLVTENKKIPDEVEKKATDTIKAGHLESLIEYDTFGEFLYFGRVPINGDGENARLDKNGVPLIKINEKYVYNPVSIAQYGLQHYSYYMIDGDKKRIDKVIIAANWLIENQDKSTGKWHYNFPFDVGGMGIMLKPGWSSAMGQGQAISLLVRAYHLTNNSKYLDAAELGLKLLRVDVKDGGFMRLFEGYAHYEEYPTTPPCYALNGFMFTLFGLYDLSYVNPSSDAALLYNEGIKSLKYSLKYYDDRENKISYYHLGHITNPPRKVHTSSFYHNVHIIQLNALNSISPDSEFVKYRDIWKSYIEQE